ncbi:MAG TPA: SDR family oxidoreductase [Mycobacteriales bacterium]|nr:SDR family oxidoreductase [Mycobacteriales bacterium]
MGPTLVTGGTGALGRAVVRQLLRNGQPVRILSRDSRPAGWAEGTQWVTGDLRTGAGLTEAVGDVTRIIHCGTSTRSGVDVGGTNRLIEAIGAARPHLIYVSIVGIDQIPLGYYRRKVRAEQIVAHSGLPWTIQRATQFHDLLRHMSQLTSRSPVTPVLSGIRFQPVDVRDLAERLLSFAGPARRAPDFGGPQILTGIEIVQAYLRAAGRRRVLLPVRLPGKTGRAYRQGANLAPEHAEGRRTFAEHLAEFVSPGRRSLPYRL